jgi:hypothetical protein
MTRAPADASPRRFKVSWRPGLLACLLIGLVSTACGQSDLRGTYRVEILIEKARAPIDAILVLTSTRLDIESLSFEARDAIGSGGGGGGSGGVDDQEEQADPNSCLILPSKDPEDAAPRSVNFFEVRIRGGDAVVPFSIFETSEQRMVVTKFQLFANALGGEILFYEPDGERPGRLIGDRLGGPTGGQCIEAMKAFHARIQVLIRAE